ncbi:2-polyprenyl-6-methoxyphenol hydroxylase-like FAD-dependent oxidoreductase [Kibdelosporangium banguiense]|uniref:2-polyprenyl-6-methoxyphenol hydroxylase-like FAD-dependent oxidoreductase n=1 Tax=Kibdelosporangium banguiense TaxID=1365924 RepID=A0ABS4TPT7_9PSEU|nr:FAD-dependent monooxygenase [Kibdelosporangium banguiense]MBP2326416.1 2-polyprenyl-6-methoxyphenol hydroxylase-like FAD-dependent oxidoreductase [Kibdelosporangium banguiense]
MTVAPVGIVGAGPIGLVAALRLASFGVRSVILETRPELLKQGSKACLIQGDALEILDKVGCAKQVADESVRWHIGHTYVRGKEIRRTEFDIPVGYGPFHNISQYRIEQVLLERVEANPLTEVWWGHNVTAVSQDEDGVTVLAETQHGRKDNRFAYLVACDGVRSTLREIVGVEWTGYSHKDRFLITDIKAVLPLAKERHFHYDPPFNPGRQLVMHPQPDDVWRIDWQLPPDADIEAEQRDGRLDRRIRAVIGDIPYEIDWLSTYRFHQRVVDRLKVGRIFFAGDAAHALPPYGSRGMNSGIQDADNLAWKLALVLAGKARESLLDTYHTERYAAAEENLRITEATIRFMVPPSRWKHMLRNTLLFLAPPVKSLRRHVNSGRMAEPHVYRESPIVEPPGDSPVLGSFAPDGKVIIDTRKVRLRTLLGHDFVGLYFGSDPAAAVRFAHEALPTRSVLVLPDGVQPQGLPDDVTVVYEKDSKLRASYGATDGTWFLIRPDGHVAATGNAADASRFAEVLRRASDGIDAHVQQEVPQ